MTRPFPAILLLAAAVAATPALAVDRISHASFDQAIADAKSVMMTDPAQAYTRASRAKIMAAQLLPADPLAEPTAEWLQGEALARQNMRASARSVLAGALQTVERVAPHDGLMGNLLLSRGWVEENEGEIAAALRDFQEAYRLLADAGQARAEARALQNIAGIYQDAGDNVRSLRYYSQASDVYHGDPAVQVSTYNNVAGTLKQLGRSEEAEQQYRRALVEAEKLKSAGLQASILNNLAVIRLIRGDVADAERLANLALETSAAPDGAEERPFAWGVLARIAAKRGDMVLAARLIGHTFAGMDLKTTSIQFRDFHKLASDIYAEAGDPQRAFAHLQAFKRLDDGVRALAASTNAALMAAQFDFSNQNLRIVQLKANRAKLHELLLALAVGAVSVVVLVLSIAILFLRRSRDAVRAANGQLSGVNLSLEKALKAKSDFLAMTSHEIRTPLNGILGMTQVMLADHQVPPPLRSRIQIVHGAGETMRALVDDILDLSKMETGALTVHRAPMRLHKLLEDAATLWRSKAEAKGLTLALDLQSCPDFIEEDEDRLRQIIFNLMSNAVKFTETGSVRLSGQAKPGEQLTLSIADSGIGISEDQHALVFEKFQQADASTSRKYGGSGLGLAICRNLAEAMGGEIELVSAPGAGSTFHLTIPLRQLASPHRESDQGEAEFGQSDSVVMLEPNPLVQRVIGKKIAAIVGDVSFVTAPVALHDQIRGKRPRIVLVQANGASHTGMTIEASLHDMIAKVHDAGARVAILLADDDGVPETALSAADLIIKKPVNADQIVEAVAQMLRFSQECDPLASAA